VDFYSFFIPEKEFLMININQVLGILPDHQIRHGKYSSTQCD
jgi:hypothetical protein